MKELSIPAKCVLMASATLMIGFSTLASTRDRDVHYQSRAVARGSYSMAVAALDFVTWPNDSFDAVDAPFVIGLLGKPSSSQEEMLEPYVKGERKVQGRTVELRRFETADEIGKCHALLITEACNQDQVHTAIQKALGTPVLTIGEAESFVASGGVLSVVKNGDASVIELNLRAADRQQLKVDVRLVNVSVLATDS